MARKSRLPPKWLTNPEASEALKRNTDTFFRSLQVSTAGFLARATFRLGYPERYPFLARFLEDCLAVPGP